MQADSEGHDDRIDGHWYEIERAAAARNCSCSQCARTEAEHTGIIAAIISRVDFSARTDQYYVGDAQKECYYPTKTPS